MTDLATLPPWHVACRADLPIAPDAVAGILDGDGTLALVRKGTERPRWVPIVGLSLRDDDPTVIAVARSLAAYIGRPVGTLHRTPRKLNWRAASLADVEAVLRFLERHPLLSPRGALQQAALAEATAVLRSARGGRSATVPLTEAEYDRLDGLRARIPARSAVTESLPLPPALLAPEDRRLGDWFSGFAAAEGSFGSQSRGHDRATPVFSITQRVDNLDGLACLRDRLGMGRIHGIPVRKGSPASAWVVDRDADVGRLIALLRKHPLPASSPKARQFDIWCELVALRAGLAATGVRGAVRRSVAVSGLVEELKAAKRYGGPVGLCACRWAGDADS